MAPKPFTTAVEVRLAIGQADDDIAPEARFRLAVGAAERIVEGPVLDASDAVRLFPTVATFVAGLVPHLKV